MKEHEFIYQFISNAYTNEYGDVFILLNVLDRKDQVVTLWKIYLQLPCFAGIFLKSLFKTIIIGWLTKKDSVFLLKYSIKILLSNSLNQVMKKHSYNDSSLK